MDSGLRRRKKLQAEGKLGIQKKELKRNTWKEFPAGVNGSYYAEVNEKEATPNER